VSRSSIKPITITGSHREARGRAQPYHHGNLRAALLEAAEAELEVQGIEGFSLRGVAKRAGVSHAAPAHHFGDANGLLTDLAAEGYWRFVAAQEARQKNAPADGMSQLVAAGMGYIDFALAHPALFRLMFSSDRPDHEAPELSAAGAEAFDRLVGAIQRVRGVDPLKDKKAMLSVMAAWAIAHGLADLLVAGRMKFLLTLRKSEREAALAQLLRQSLAHRS
jgi:AcrR family transcriptional regulator